MLLVVAGLAAGPAVAGAQTETLTFPERLVRRVDVNDSARHLLAFQRIAETNGGTRAAGSPGYDASADYVAGVLERAGWDVTRQSFEFEYSEDNSTFEQTAPASVPYEVSVDFLAADFSLNTSATGPLVPVDLVLPPTPEPSSSSGCEADDFAGFPAGGVALIQRGTCDFTLKALNAQAAGAVGVVLFNEGQPGRTDLLVPTGEAPGLTIPVVFTTFDVGNTLAATEGVVVALSVDVFREMRSTVNVLAQTRTGRADNVIMAGAHLDSVPEGPGVNDNGSGSAALLEIANEMGGSPRVNNAVRLAFWGAEEFGLLGSEHYVSSLSFEEQLDIALYLNFDMIGSPNAGYFVYDGDDSDGEGAGPGPFGSDVIEQEFVDFLASIGVDTQGTDFDGRSDYGPFIAVGIASGGLFTGAEDVKTAEQAALWGGRAGIPFDPCYHQACDNLGNVKRGALARNQDAAAWTIATFARSSRDVNGIGSREQRAAARAALAAESLVATGTGSQAA
jgi:Zn-dependent M28 family amino/carboxypeptidase